MAGTDSRQGDGSWVRPLRLVACRGMSRRMPGCSQTTQTRPRRGVLVTAANGSVNP